MLISLFRRDSAFGRAVGLGLFAALVGSMEASAAPDDAARLSLTLPPEHHPFRVGAFAGTLFPPRRHALRVDSLPYEHYSRAALDLGARAGWYPLRFVGVEGEAALIPLSAEDGSSATIYALRASLAAQLPLGRLRPFALVGYGNLNGDSELMGSDSDLSFHYGAGLEFALLPSLLLRLDARDTLTERQSADKQPHWPELLLGVSYQFGGTPTVIRAVVRDDDHDGIADASDDCPAAPANTPNGCPTPSRATLPEAATHLSE